MAAAADGLGGIGELLRGGDAQSAQQAAAADPHGGAATVGGPGVDISKLSQLSDFADKEAAAEQGQPSQEALIAAAAAAPLAYPGDPTALAAQAVLGNHSGMSAPMSVPGTAADAEEQQRQMAAAVAAATAAAPLLPEQMMALMPGMLGALDPAMWGAVPHMEAEMAEQPGPRSRSGKPTRRGPMDEMRQLVRILVKLLPQSIAYIGANEEAGGGNRISEEQIKAYLEKTLGDAPRPTWGVPNGWYSYVSELFTWALGRLIDEEACKKCAKREPGRSWEALEGELAAIGVHPHCWPLPLTHAGVQAAEKNPIAQPIPAVPIAKRGDGGDTGGPRRGRASMSVVDLDRLTEYELWKHVNDALNACTNKQGTSPADLVAQVSSLKAQAKGTIDLLAAGAGLNMLQYVPVLGMDGNPSMMAFLGGMQGMPMGLPPVPGQLVGPDGQLLPADGAAAVAAAAQAMDAATAEAVAAAGHAAAAEEPPAKRLRVEGEQGEEKPSADKLTADQARGTLFGALGGDGKDEKQLQQEQDAAAAAAAAQLPLMYGGQPGTAAFMMPGFAGLPAGFGAEGGAPADGAPADSEPAPAPTGDA